MANGPDRDSYHRVRAVFPDPKLCFPLLPGGKSASSARGTHPTRIYGFARSDTNGRLQPVLKGYCVAAPRTSALWVSRHTCTLGEPRWQTRDRDSEGYVKSSRNTEGRASCGKVRRSPHHGTCASPRILSMYRASNPAGPDPFLSDSSRKTGGEKLPGEAALQKK